MEGAVIRAPHRGQRVTLRYRPSQRQLGPHGERGEVLVAARGRGPRNALVRPDSGRLVVVVRGQLWPGDFVGKGERQLNLC